MQQAAVDEGIALASAAYIASKKPDPLAALRFRAQAAAAGNLTLALLLSQPQNAIYLDLILKPVTGTQFTTSYVLDVSTLAVVKQIDLEA